MVKNELAAYLLMEATTDPVEPRNLKVFDKDQLFYLRFDTILQSFNVRNRNGRIYMGHAMIPSLNADHIIELERMRSWFGEAGHPISDDIKRILTINPQMISHKIVSHTVDNNYCKGTIETLDNDSYGRQMTKSILQGMKPAFSLRALAPLTKRADGTQLVQSKAHVVCYDWVILPSHRDAYIDETKPIQKIVKKIEDGGNGLTESFAQVVNESMVKDFIAMESTNVKVVSNVCEIATENMTVSSDLKNVILKEGDLTYFVPMEEKIKDDIRNYLSKM